jgi:glycosyltransferase involved in cell wall biosynthesis
MKRKPHMEISVNIPCLNVVNTIEFQLEALACQCSKSSYEIIFSDNGSTDETLDLVKKYKNRFKKLTVVDSSAKKGAGYARNNGVKFAKGDALLFCDTDDVVGNDWIDAMQTALKNHEFVAGRLKWFKNL